jgi:uncharacterized membrane protein (DUF2068 family)
MLRFLWTSTRGYRLRPWASPYLRWRMETYWGVHAGSLTRHEFSALAWNRRTDLWRFLRWADRMRTNRAKVHREEMGNAKEKSPAALLAIALFKLIKGLLLIATGVGALSLLHKDVEQTVTHWISLLRVDPDNEWIHGLASRLFSITPKQLKEISAGTFFYAALLLTEGVGLLLRKHWAEYFTVITTAALIPLEIYEIAKHFTIVKVGVLAINVAILVYLIRRLRAGHTSGAVEIRDAA